MQEGIMLVEGFLLETENTIFFKHGAQTSMMVLNCFSYKYES